MAQGGGEMKELLAVIIVGVYGYAIYAVLKGIFNE